MRQAAQKQRLLQTGSHSLLSTINDIDSEISAVSNAVESNRVLVLERDKLHGGRSQAHGTSSFIS